MAYYSANNVQGKSSVSCGSRYGSVRVEYADGMYVVHGRRGKKYVLFGEKTANGSVIAEKIFPRTAVKICVSASDGKMHLWIRSLMRARRTYMKSRAVRPYRRSRGYTQYSRPIGPMMR